MENVLWNAGVHRNGTNLQKSVQLLAYADDIDIIGCTKRDVTAAFSAIERGSTKMSLTINEGKTKYMLTTSRDVRRIGSQITADNNSFDTVNEFIYLGYAVTNQKWCQSGDQTYDHSYQQILLWSQWAIE